MAFHTSTSSDDSANELAASEAGPLDHSLYYLSMLIALPLYVLGALGYAIAFVSALIAQTLFNCAGALVEQLDRANCRIRSGFRTVPSRRSAVNARADR